MRIALLTACALTTASCGGVGEFERELSGPQAIAWETCIEEGLGFQPESPPEYGEVSDNWILFAWTEAGAKASGGASACRTSGDGKELLEVHISGVY